MVFEETFAEIFPQTYCWPFVVVTRCRWICVGACVHTFASLLAGGRGCTQRSATPMTCWLGGAFVTDAFLLQYALYTGECYCTCYSMTHCCLFEISRGGRISVFVRALSLSPTHAFSQTENRSSHILRTCFGLAKTMGG